MGGQFHWNPDEYRALMRAEVPGTGETAARVLAAHPRAHLLGVDSSEPMLGVARDVLDEARATVRVGRLEDPLPPGPFDLCEPLTGEAQSAAPPPSRFDLARRVS